MQPNPLFPGSSSQPSPAAGQGSSGVPADDEAGRLAAADLIRRKVAAAYGTEPDAQEELNEVSHMVKPMSRHQEFMQNLKATGKSLVEIQAAWHAYYAGLSDAEKHEVWQEFYSNQHQAATPAQQEIHKQEVARPVAATPQVKPAIIPSAATPAATAVTPQPAPGAASGVVQSSGAMAPADPQVDPKPTKGAAQPSVADIKERIRNTVSAGGKLKPKHHLQSLGFGLACGTVVLVIFLFSFFNEVFLAPFIQPSRRVSETPVIVDPASTIVSKDPKVIIPKINVEIPVDYSQTTTDEKAIETALDSAVVHYPTTVRPGQTGNAAFFGHSSNNIFNPGKYKFAFVLLSELQLGDTFYLTYEGKAFAYEVISSRVVQPTEVSVLGPVEGQTATATLITCDPPGTSINRLVVVGKQVSPAPAGNVAPPAQPQTPVLSASAAQADLPGNGPTLWSRLWGSIF